MPLFGERPFRAKDKSARRAVELGSRFSSSFDRHRRNKIQKSSDSVSSAAEKGMKKAPPGEGPKGSDQAF